MGELYQKMEQDLAIKNLARGTPEKIPAVLLRVRAVLHALAEGDGARRDRGVPRPSRARGSEP
jgi:hypothetical protein